MDEFSRIIKDLQKRVEAIERQALLRNVTIPADGFLVVDSQASDPAAADGRIYYNTTANKYKVCENGVWKTITTS